MSILDHSNNSLYIYITQKGNYFPEEGAFLKKYVPFCAKNLFQNYLSTLLNIVQRASVVQWLRPLTLKHWISHRNASSLAGLHVGCQTLHRSIRRFYSGHSGFRPPPISDRLDISKLFLKGRSLLFSHRASYLIILKIDVCKIVNIGLTRRKH